MFDLLVDLPHHRLLFHILAAIVKLLAGAERDFHFHECLLEIHPQRHEGAATGVEREFDFLDVASWLVLEVTETVLMADPVVAATALARIRDLGVRVALDDFGSGYSWLSPLRRFPIDIVKIDKSFVDDVAHDGAESAIARGIIELGRAMGIQTVAEGIEVDEQAEILRTLGCELGQGFFFARPLAPEGWAGLLRAGLTNGGGSGDGRA